MKKRKISKGSQVTPFDLEFNHIYYNNLPDSIENIKGVVCECWAIVLSFLDWKKIRGVERTCKLFYFITHNPHMISKTISFFDFFGAGSIEDFNTNYIKTVDLFCHDIKYINFETLVKIGRKFPNVEQIFCSNRINIKETEFNLFKQLVNNNMFRNLKKIVIKKYRKKSKTHLSFIKWFQDKSITVIQYKYNLCFICKRNLNSMKRCALCNKRYCTKCSKTKKFGHKSEFSSGECTSFIQCTCTPKWKKGRSPNPPYLIELCSSKKKICVYCMKDMEKCAKCSKFTTSYIKCNKCNKTYGKYCSKKCNRCWIQYCPKCDHVCRRGFTFNLFGV